MQVVNFEYNEELLSDYNLIICNFDGTNGFETMNIGNNIVINKIKAPNSNKYKSIGYSYEDVFKMEFQVGKLGCNVDNRIISETEINKIARWLNRKTYGKFKAIYDDGSFSNVYYNGVFNIQIIKFGDDIIGLTLTFESNSPFAYMDAITYNCESLSSGQQFIIDDISDETGYLYAFAEIECLESGNLIIDNVNDYNRIIVNNCLQGEIITLNGENKIISSSLPSHSTLPNDFNYKFLRIINEYDNVKNIFTSNIKCRLKITYSPVRKVGTTL